MIGAILILSGGPTSAGDGYFKCVSEYQVIYSDQPCSRKAKRISFDWRKGGLGSHGRQVSAAEAAKVRRRAETIYAKLLEGRNLPRYQSRSFVSAMRD